VVKLAITTSSSDSVNASIHPRSDIAGNDQRQRHEQETLRTGIASRDPSQLSSRLRSSEVRRELHHDRNKKHMVSVVCGRSSLSQKARARRSARRTNSSNEQAGDHFGHHQRRIKACPRTTPRPRKEFARGKAGCGPTCRAASPVSPITASDAERHPGGIQPWRRSLKNS